MILLLFFLTGCLAYLEETFEISVIPEDLGIADECTYFADHNHTYIRFHNGTQIQTNYMSSIFAINNQCDLVVFGYPNENKVIFSTKEQKPVTISSDSLSGNKLTSEFGAADRVNTENLNVSIGDAISGSGEKMTAVDSSERSF